MKPENSVCVSSQVVSANSQVEPLEDIRITATNMKTCSLASRFPESLLLGFAFLLLKPEPHPLRQGPTALPQEAQSFLRALYHIIAGRRTSFQVLCTQNSHGMWK